MIESIAEVLGLLPRLLSELGDRFFEYRSPEYGAVAPLADFLTCRLVYFLRYLDHVLESKAPLSYAEVMAAYIDDGRPAIGRFGPADAVWDRAAQYACAYLSALGLVHEGDAMGGGVAITERGREVIASTEIRERFRSAFEQPLAS